MYTDRLSLILTVIIFLSGCASSNEHTQSDSSAQKPVEDIIPVTMANMRGHKALYKEGWFVITSSDAALAYAKKKSFISSREALTLAASSIANESEEYAEALADDWALSIKLGKKTFTTGTRITRKIYSVTTGLAADQVDYGLTAFQKSWSRFIKGNLHIVRRTQTTRNCSGIVNLAT